MRLAAAWNTSAASPIASTMAPMGSNGNDGWVSIVVRAGGFWGAGFGAAALPEAAGEALAESALAAGAVEAPGEPCGIAAPNSRSLEAGELAAPGAT